MVRTSCQLDRRDDFVRCGINNAQGVVRFNARKQLLPISLDRQSVNFVGQADVIYRVQRLQVNDTDIVALAIVHIQPDVLSRRCRRRDHEAQNEEKNG